MGKGDEDNFCGSRTGRLEHYTYREINEFIHRWVAPKGPPLRQGLQKYVEFEDYVRSLDITFRATEADIRRLATRWVFTRWGMFTQQANNEIQNYVRTYEFKYRT